MAFCAANGEAETGLRKAPPVARRQGSPDGKRWSGGLGLRRPRSEGERLGRAFVKAVVQAICAEAELRQRFREHPQDKLTYEGFWDTLS